MTSARRTLGRTLHGPAGLMGMLGLLFFAAALVRTEGAGGELRESALGPFMVGWLLMAGWTAGRLAERCALPRVTGYLVLGLFAGAPAAALLHLPFTILDQRAIDSIELVDDIAIALIGLLAGSEIKLGTLRPHWRTALRLLRGQALFLVLPGACLLWYFAIARGAPSLDHALSSSTILASIAGGLVLLANSPAIMVAVIREMGAHGSLAVLALSTTILKDIVLTVVFTAVLGIAAAGLGGVTGGTDLGTSLMGVGTHLVGSLVVGALLGPALALVASKTSIRDDALTALSAIAVVALASHYHLSVLLTSLAAGIVATNLPRLDASRLNHATDSYLVPVLCVAFPLIGAALDLQAAFALAPVAVGLALLRAGGLWAGCRLAIAADSLNAAVLKRSVWMAFVPQAAVALALLSDFRSQLQEVAWGPTMHTMLVGMVVVNALVGPMLLRTALRRDEASSA